MKDGGKNGSGRKTRDVNRYWMTFKETRGYCKLKEKALVALCGELALVEAVDRAQNRLRGE